MKPKVVILGNSGFIGSSIERDFQKTDKFQVEGYNSSNLNLNLKESSKQLAEVLNKETILIVLARSRNAQNRIDSFHHNILMDQNIARCLEKNPVKKCIYFSSISVYGETATNNEITENTPVDPSTFYGVTKLAGEKILQITAQKSRFPLLTLRCCKVYGPGNSDTTSYGPDQFINTILSENKLCLFGNGEEKRDYLFIQDLVDIIRPLVLGETTGILNLASGKSFTFKEISSIFRHIIKGDFNEIISNREKPIINQGFNIEMLLNACPDITFTDLQEGLLKTWNFVSKQTPCI
jgi:UDP-glucose 4-epimerase